MISQRSRELCVTCSLGIDVRVPRTVSLSDAIFVASSWEVENPLEWSCIYKGGVGRIHKPPLLLVLCLSFSLTPSFPGCESDAQTPGRCWFCVQIFGITGRVPSSSLPFI